MKTMQIKLKYNLIKEIEAVTLAMKNGLEKGDLDSFFKSLDDRQKIMARMNDMDGPMPSRIDSGDDKAVIVQTEKDILTSLQNVREMNKIISAMADENLNNIKHKIKGLVSSKIAMSNYSKKLPQTKGYFVEKKK